MKLVSLTELPLERVSHNPAVTKRVLLRGHDLPHLVQFAQATFPPGESAPAHSHADMVEVFFVEAGRGQITVDGTPYPLEPGSCVVVEPGEGHELANTGAGSWVVTYFGLVV